MYDLSSRLFLSCVDRGSSRAEVHRLGDGLEQAGLIGFGSFAYCVGAGLVRAAKVSAGTIEKGGGITRIMQVLIALSNIVFSLPSGANVTKDVPSYLRYEGEFKDDSFELIKGGKVAGGGSRTTKRLPMIPLQGVTKIGDHHFSYMFVGGDVFLINGIRNIKNLAFMLSRHACNK